MLPTQRFETRDLRLELGASSFFVTKGKTAYNEAVHKVNEGGWKEQGRDAGRGVSVLPPATSHAATPHLVVFSFGDDALYVHRFRYAETTNRDPTHAPPPRRGSQAPPPFPARAIGVLEAPFPPAEVLPRALPHHYPTSEVGERTDMGQERQCRGPDARAHRTEFRVRRRRAAHAASASPNRERIERPKLVAVVASRTFASAAARRGPSARRRSSVCST